ncbi:hypothetical protein [Lentzea sp. NPDC060358]|uniref:hypothetical protein n=1 Tax=Lentzea sp. NPDC060358 TaxID=3347103 RepID=UPI00365455F0
MRVGDELHELAAALGVATCYGGVGGERVAVDPSVVRAVLTQLEVDVSSASAVRGELTRARDRRAAGALPDAVVLTGRQALELPGRGVLHCESGREVPVTGELRADRLPLGVHALDSGGRRVALLVVPRGAPTPPPAWGWTVHRRRGGGAGRRRGRQGRWLRRPGDR